MLYLHKYGMHENSQTAIKKFGLKYLRFGRVALFLDELASLFICPACYLTPIGIFCSNA